jgi:hypothetical protein
MHDPIGNADVINIFTECRISRCRSIIPRAISGSGRGSLSDIPGVFQINPSLALPTRTEAISMAALPVLLAMNLRREASIASVGSRA